jgi:hypothetical protein
MRTEPPFGTPELAKPDDFDSRFRFETFFVGASNEAAYDAARAVADSFAPVSSATLPHSAHGTVTPLFLSSAPHVVGDFLLRLDPLPFGRDPATIMRNAARIAALQHPEKE